VFVRTNGAGDVKLTYKGTSTLRDLATDFNAVPVFKSDLLPEGEGYIHGGFLEAFKSTWPQVEAHLHAHAASLGCTAADLTYETGGHSLGGAQATLAALQLILIVKQPLSQLRQATFGSPRVMSHAAAAYFNRTMGSRTLRVSENDVDIVTMVAPGFLGFKHVGVNLAVCKPAGVLPHLMEGYAHGVASLNAITFTPTYALGARRSFFLALRQLIGRF
jgi:hypothetical protein